MFKWTQRLRLTLQVAWSIKRIWEVDGGSDKTMVACLDHPTLPNKISHSEFRSFEGNLHEIP